ncbi:MAG: PAS domain S-box protein [Desulfobacteraceae bacterium]|nr:PAS domain S-box protein [Desulfobacteraceae bacterium]
MDHGLIGHIERLEDPAEILERISDGFLALDEDLRVTCFSRAAEEQLRKFRDQVMGRCLFDVFPEARGSVIEESFHAALRDRKAMAFETYFAPLDEWYEVRVSPAPGGIDVYFRVITERKQAEEALRESEEALRTVFNSTYDGILLHTPDGAIVDFNERFLRMYNLRPEEAKDLRILDISDPSMPVDSLGTIWQQVLAGREQFFEWQARRYHGGITFPVEVFLRRLREAHGLLEGIIEGSPDFIAALDKDFRYILFNTAYQREFAKVFGLELRAGMSMTEAMAHQPGDLREATALWGRAIRGETFSVVREFGDPRRERKTYELRISPIRDARGELIGAAHMARDVSERARMEEALRRSEERYRLVAELTHDWEYWLDPQGNYLYVSPSCEKVTGYPPTRFQEDPGFMVSVIHPEDRTTYTDHQHESLTEGTGPLMVEFRVVDRGGAEHWIEHVCQPVYGSDGRFLGRRGSNRDITDRKRTEEELQKAQRLESIGILAGGIAHDFNNILTAILGNLALARMQLPPESPAGARLASAERAALRAKGLSLQLLTFAKGGAPIKKAVSIPTLVREVAELALRGSKVKSEMALPPDLWPVEADESQLSQVVSNIIINGVQAMPEGGRMGIGAANEELAAGNHLGLAAGRYVRIEIRDEGSGIPPQDLDRIFDPYFTTKEGGSGLGLAISYSIMKRHGGAIGVDSQPGRGSTFSLHLPASAGKPAGQPENGATPGGGGRVLVMDNEEAVNDVAAAMLEHLGYQATTVRDGAGALDAYRRALAAGEPFAAVITDLTVPGGVGGREVAEKILAMDPEAKVIVSSGYANDPVMSHYAEYGFTGVVPKPYKLAELGKALREAVGG